ncbi:MAG: DNA recombination protein RmuC [Desulfobacteraceae bacterium]|nr:DNA recombination protein RmuC [Desulfobacteraceae bacterium]
MNNYIHIIITGAGVLAGILSCFLIFKALKSKKANEAIAVLEQLKQKLESAENQIHEKNQSLQLLEEKNKEAETQNKQLGENLIRYREQSLIIPELKENLKNASELIENLRQKNQEESFARIKSEQKLENYENLQETLKKKDMEISFLNEKISDLQSRLSDLAARFEEQKKQNQERIHDLNEAKDKMALQFESLANRILEEKTQKFTEQNKTNLNEILNPVKEQIGEFRNRIDQIHYEDSQNRSKLSEQISGLFKINQEMNKEAKNLTRALKGDNKIQGNWGEMILEKVLEQSGLRKGKEYIVQTGFRNSENRLFKPDVIVHLPDDKDIIIDSKVSLNSYNEYINALEKEDQEKTLKAHVMSVKAHITGLAEKNYENLEGIRSLDFILMFMPIDAAFMAAFQYDENLFNLAFEKRIVVVTPTTLLATLRTIENIWRYERQNQNSAQIAEKAGKIYEKLTGFLIDFEKLGKSIDTLKSTYKSASNKLTSGRGNLIKQAQGFIELGVSVKKEIPSSFSKNADFMEDEDLN